MKQKLFNGLMVFTSLINTIVIVALFLGVNGVNALELFKHEDETKTKGRAIIPTEITGQILSSYSDTEECRVVTIVEVESAMSQIGEITTVSYDYSGVSYESDCSKFFQWEVGLTRNSIEVEYEGTIRAGYVIEDIQVSVDNENEIITLTLPDVQIFSNEITDEDIDWDNNFFNHIDPDAATDLIEEAREDELEEAIENGLYTEAEENAKMVITNILSEVCDYEIVFTNTASAAN